MEKRSKANPFQKRFENPFDPEMSFEQVEELLEEDILKKLNRNAFPSRLQLEDILKNDSRVVKYDPGELIFRMGDYGNSAMIILEGSVRVLPGFELQGLLGASGIKNKGYLNLAIETLRQWLFPLAFSEIRTESQLTFQKRQSRKEGHQRLKNYEQILSRLPQIRLSRGQMFGEIAALSRSPRNASIVAEQQVRCLEIRWQGIRDIRQYDRQFRNHVDQLYRERSLKTHLKQTDLFKNLDDQVLEEVVRETSFDSFGDFNWDFIPDEYAKLDSKKRLDKEPLIVHEGDYINDLILVRAGFARVSRVMNFGHHTTGYLSAGDLFGLEESLSNFEKGTRQPYRYSLRAIGFVDLIRVPLKTLEKNVFPHRANAGKKKSKSLWKPWNFGKPEKPDILDGFLDFIVDNRFNNGRAGMVIDLNRCTGCDDCVRACSNAHDQSPRFIRSGKVFGHFQVVNACMHCVDPVCMIGCPTGAIHRQAEGGQVVITDQTCIGCGSCASNCPYQAIQMVPVRTGKGTYWKAENNRDPLLKASKCDLCVQQKTGPACVYACPHGALERVDMKEFSLPGGGSRE